MCYKDPFICLDNVSFQYKDSEQGVALTDVSLEIERGEVVLLCGQSGCGKTTITRLVNGLIPQFYEGDLWGAVYVGGRDVSVESVNDTAHFVGSVFQNPKTQFFTVDVESELAFGCENLGWAPEAIKVSIAEEVERFDIAPFLKCSLFKLSGGEKQKIACASVSAAHPSVVVLDEPTSNLDIASIHMITDVIRRWKKAGKTVIIAEHRLAYLTDIVDRVVLMDEGKVVFDRSVAEVLEMEDSQIAAFGLRSIRTNWFESSEQPCIFQGNPEEKLSIHGLYFGHKARTFGGHFSGAVRSKAPGGIWIDELSIPLGAVVGVVGNNGAGKTTFARCLCGLEKHAKGRIVREGKDYCRKKRRDLCYLVMQDVNHQLFTESVAEEVRLGMQDIPCTPDKREQRVDQVLQDLDLLQYREVHPLSLSGGQKQRVAIASALASERKIMVFDEPTSGLDLRHMLETAEGIRSLAEKKVTSFVITHDPELIAACCNWAIFIEDGKLAWSQAMNEDCLQKLRRFFMV